MANRLTQLAREVLEPGPGNARLTQLAREVLEQGNPSARVTQVAREVLVAINRWNPAEREAATSAETAAITEIRDSAADDAAPASSDTAAVTGVTDAASDDTAAATSETALVTIQEESGANARLTQLAREVLAQGNASARLTQLALEVLALGNPKARVTQLAREVLVRLDYWTPGVRVGPATDETAELVSRTFAATGVTTAVATAEVAFIREPPNYIDLGGITIACFTGSGTPVVPEPPAPKSANYVF